LYLTVYNLKTPVVRTEIKTNDIFSSMGNFIAAWEEGRRG
jgi:hypothetical protein